MLLVHKKFIFKFLSTKTTMSDKIAIFYVTPSTDYGHSDVYDGYAFVQVGIRTIVVLYMSS